MNPICSSEVLRRQASVALILGKKLYDRDRYSVEVLVTRPAPVNLYVYLRDGNRRELDEMDGDPDLAFKTQLVIGEPTDGQDCELTRRACEVLGGQVYRSMGEVIMQEQVLKRSEYVSFAIDHQELLPKAEIAGSHKSWRNQDGHVVQFHKRRLNRRRLNSRSLFFLTTQQSANQRIMAIAERFGLTNRRDDATCDALTNLLFAVYAGGDNSLVTEALEDDVCAV